MKDKDNTMLLMGKELNEEQFKEWYENHSESVLSE